MRRRAATALLLAALAGMAGAAPKAAPAPAPKELAGRAGKVIDGDTLWFKPDDGGTETVVRIDGIDAPEICQDWGREAQQALRERVQDQPLLLQVRGVDEYGRSLAKIYADGVDVGDRLVRDGNAWSMRYRSDRGPYLAGERVAQTLQRGLHASPGAQQPRKFRLEHGPCH